MKAPSKVKVIAIACFFAVGFVLAATSESAWANEVSRHALSLAVCAWILADARERGRRVCYDFDSFLFFAWPVVAPMYLLQTRGIRGVIPMAVFGLIWVGAGAGGKLMGP